jgi:hypothetical protein
LVTNELADIEIPVGASSTSAGSAIDADTRKKRLRASSHNRWRIEFKRNDGRRCWCCRRDEHLTRRFNFRFVRNGRQDVSFTHFGPLFWRQVERESTVMMRRINGMKEMMSLLEGSRTIQ